MAKRCSCCGMNIEGMRQKAIAGHAVLYIKPSKRTNLPCSRFAIRCKAMGTILRTVSFFTSYVAVFPPSYSLSLSHTRISAFTCKASTHPDKSGVFCACSLRDRGSEADRPSCVTNQGPLQICCLAWLPYLSSLDITFVFSFLFLSPLPHFLKLACVLSPNVGARFAKSLTYTLTDNIP